MDTVQSTEQALEQAVEDGKEAIKIAQALMDNVSLLKKKLNIKEGAGRRYLQKLKPDTATLLQIEKEITNQYARPTAPPKAAAKKHKNLMGALVRHGRA